MHEGTRTRFLLVTLLAVATACMAAPAWAQCGDGNAVIHVEARSVGRVFSEDNLVFSVAPVAPVGGAQLESVSVLVNRNAVLTVPRASLPNPAGTGWLELSYQYQVGTPTPGTVLLREDDSGLLNIVANYTGGSCYQSPSMPVQTGSANTFAVIVGINEYPKAHAKLSFARQDAEALAQLILDNFPKMKRRNIYLLTDPWRPEYSEDGVDKYADIRNEATREHILDSLSDVYNQIDRHGKFIFYFSGHGFASTQPIFIKADYLLTRDASTYNDSLMISMEDIAQRMHTTPAKEKILILDACFSDRLVVGLPNGATATQQGGRGRALSATVASQGIGTLFNPADIIYVLTAGTNDDLAYELDKLQHGVLTSALLDSIKHPLRVNGDLNMGVVFDYADAEVRDQLNKYMPGKTQRPNHYIFGQGDRIIWLRQLGAP
jgi:uncharacterized caspase-like protein